MRKRYYARTERSVQHVRVVLRPGTVLPTVPVPIVPFKHTWTHTMRVWKRYAPYVNDKGEEKTRYVGIGRCLFVTASEGGTDAPRFFRLWCMVRNGGVAFSLASSHSPDGPWTKQGKTMDSTDAVRYLDSLFSGNGAKILLSLLESNVGEE